MCIGETTSQVFLRYCSSDAHLGDQSRTDPVHNQTWHFRGQNIVQSTVKDLVLRQNLGAAALAGRREIVIFAGGSAGSRGALSHLESVQGLVATATATKLGDKFFELFEVVGFFDSPLWIDITPFAGKVPPYQGDAEYTKTFVEYMVAPSAGANSSADPAKTVFGSACYAKYAPGNEHWKCLFPEYRLPFLNTSTHYMVVQSLDDMMRLRAYIGHAPTTAAEKKYHQNQMVQKTKTDIQSWFSGQAPTTSSMISAFLGSGTSSGTTSSTSRSFFALRCYTHDTSRYDWGFSESYCETESNTMRAVMQRWLKRVVDKTVEVEVAMDECDTFQCSQGCGKV